MQNEATKYKPETIIINIKKAIFDRQSVTIAGGEFSPADLQGLLDLLACSTCSTCQPAPVKSRARAVKAVNPLTLAKGVMPTRSPLPILSRYAIQGGRARCMDLENLLTFPAPVNAAGGVLDDGIYLDLSGELVRDNAFTLEDFPPVPAPVDITPAAVFKAGDLLRVLGNALPMASTDETRYILNGVFMRRRIDGGPVEIVSTDGRRLHAVTIDGGAGAPFAGVVRSSAVKVLIKAAAGMEPCAGVSVNILKHHAGTDEKGAALFGTSFAFDLSGGAAGGAVLETKEIEGTYPNYLQVIPDNKNPDWLRVQTPVNAAAWLAAFKTLEPVRKHIRKNDSDNNADTVYLTFTPAGRVTAVLNSCLTGFEKTAIEFGSLASAAGVWRARDKHPETGADIPADALTIAFSLPFLSDILKTGPDALSLQDNLSPGLFAAAGGALSVLMPIRVS